MVTGLSTRTPPPRRHPDATPEDCALNLPLDTLRHDSRPGTADGQSAEWQRRVDAASWEHRTDRGELLSAHRRADGTLLVEGYAAREGVLEYRQGDRVFRELVTDATLRAAAGGLGRSVVTLEHPDPKSYPEGVTTKNYDKLSIGDTDGEVVMEDGGFVRVKIAVRRADAVEAVEAGKQELSPGYAVRLDPTPGTHPKHGRYDAIQIERCYNHLAIVDQARGGPKVRFRADHGIATTAITRALAGTPTPTPGPRPSGATVNPRFLRLLTLLGVTSRVDTDDAAIDAACGALDTRADAARTADTAAATKLATETARADSEKARADKAEADLTKLRAADTARVDAADRVELVELATRYELDAAKHPATPEGTKALRRAIAEAHLGSALRADATDDYVRALTDLARESTSARGDGRADGRAVLDAATGTGKRQDGPDPRRAAVDDRTTRPKKSTMATRWGGSSRNVGGAS